MNITKNNKTLEASMDLMMTNFIYNKVNSKFIETKPIAEELRHVNGATEYLELNKKKVDDLSNMLNDSAKTFINLMNSDPVNKELVKNISFNEVSKVVDLASKYIQNYE